MQGVSPILTPLNLGVFNTTPSQPVSPPSVLLNPSSSTESVGLYHTFVSDFSGGGLTYQWYKNGVAISGTNNKNYGFLPSSANNGDTFYCIATNDQGSAQTTTATLSLRPRIYFNTSIWQTFNTSTTIKVIFKDTGFIDIVTSEGLLANFDTWVSPTNDPNLGVFNIQDYQVRVQNLPSYLTKVGGTVGETFTDVVDGVYIELELTGLSVNESGLFRLEYRDKVLPNYNWAGWDEGDVFVRKI